MTDNQKLRDAFGEWWEINGFGSDALPVWVAGANHILSQLDTPEMLEAVALLLQNRSYEALHISIDQEQAEDYAQAAIEAIKKAVV